MLSGEGNENGEKTTVRLISKIATLHVMHTFFVHFFVVVLHVYDEKLPENSQLHVLWRKCRTCFCSLSFSPVPNFHLGGRQHFPCSRHRYKIFMLFFQQKMSPFFFSLALAFCRSFSRRPALACRPFSLFLCLSLSLYFKFVDMTINLSLILQTTHIEIISAFRCRLYLLLSCLCFTRRGWLCVFHKNNLELPLRCHTRLQSYFTLVCLLLLRTDGRKYGHVITKISRMNRLPHFLRYMGLYKGARLELRYEKRNVYRLLGRLI